MIDPVVSVSLRCLLALLFALAAWHKASDSTRFASTLQSYRLVPSWLGRTLVMALPVIEISIAIVLLLPLHAWYPWAALVAVGLLVAYSVAIAINLARGRRDIDCGCFGPAARVSLSGALIARNGLLIGAAVAVALPVTRRPVLWMDVFTIVLVVTIAILLWTSFWRLAEGRRVGGHP